MRVDRSSAHALRDHLGGARPPTADASARLGRTLVPVPSVPARAFAGELPPPDGDLAVIRDHTSECLILQVHGELDLATGPALEHELERAWASHPPALVLDLEGLRFMDSTGVKLIVEAHRRAIAEDKRFSLRRLTSQVQRVCDLAGLTGRVPIDD